MQNIVPQGIRILDYIISCVAIIIFSDAGGTETSYLWGLEVNSCFCPVCVQLACSHSLFSSIEVSSRFSGFLPSLNNVVG